MTSRIAFRTRRSFWTAVLVTAIATLPWTSQVHALDLVTITCAAGTETSEYSPGITNTTQNVTFTENETDACVDTGDLTITGASEESSAVESISCTGSTDVGPYNVIFHWDNGQNSVVDITNTIITKLVNGETQAERLGTVSSGPGAGEAFTQTITTANLNVGACSSSQGLISNSGVVITSIAPL